MDNDYHGRFKDAPWYGVHHPITVGGVGGIGSWLSFLLGRIGHSLYLFDDDIIDTTNLGGQLYPESDIGVGKVDSMIKTIRQFSGHKEVYNMGRFHRGTEVQPITFACFDNMMARMEMFEAWHSRNYLKRAGKAAIFIDGRMTAESFQVYCVTPGTDTVQRYRETLFHDSEVGELPCSMKATSHIGANIASAMVECLNNYLTNFNLSDDERDVPFKIWFEAPLVFTDVEL